MAIMQWWVCSGVLHAATSASDSGIINDQTGIKTLAGLAYLCVRKPPRRVSYLTSMGLGVWNVDIIKYIYSEISVLLWCVVVETKE